MFTERYVHSVNSSDLRDDDTHHSTEALMASAYADSTSGYDAVFGSLLCRVKYADGTVHKMFEAGTHNLAILIRVWTELVTAKGRARGWIKAKTAWDIQASFTLFERVAHASLAHWLDGRCEQCNGTGKIRIYACTCCGGDGRAQIEAGRYETELILDMVSELEGIYQSYGGRAKALMRTAPTPLRA